VKHHRLIFDTDLPQPAGAASGDRHRAGVIGIGLAPVTGRQHPNPGGQLGRHIHHPLPVRHQLLGEGPADAMRALHRPGPLRPAAGPLAQALVAGAAGWKALVAQQLAALVERGGGMGGLVRVDADGHWHAGTLLEMRAGTTKEGTPTLS
jgi:hypothetical protein